MADQDRFIVSITAVGIPTNSFPQDFAPLLRQTQLDYSHYSAARFTGSFGGDTYPQNGQEAIIIQVTADDVFQGNAAGVQTVKDQFDAVFQRYMVSYHSEITGQQIIPAHSQPVVTHIDGNGQPVITNIPIANNGTPFGANPVTSTGINNFAKGLGLSVSALGMLAILAVAVISKNRQ